jgi:hypothetical protein
MNDPLNNIALNLRQKCIEWIMKNSEDPTKVLETATDLVSSLDSATTTEDRMYYWSRLYILFGNPKTYVEYFAACKSASAREGISNLRFREIVQIAWIDHVTE